MAKLSAKAAKEVDKAESSFDPIEDGVYHVRLRDLQVKESKAGNPMWALEFEIVEEPYVNRRLWTNLTQVEAALFKTNEFFAAYDVPSTTDTDELLGQICKAVVASETQQEGAGKGQIHNTISRLAKADEDFEPEQTTGAVKGDDGEDLF
jgi:hypothetical protein